jgi:hypothetical protein
LSKWLYYYILFFLCWRKRHDIKLLTMPIDKSKYSKPFDRIERGGHMVPSMSYIEEMLAKRRKEDPDYWKRF